MRKKKFIIYFILFLLFISMVSIYAANSIIINACKGKLYSNIEAIPYNKTGLLLGTGKFLSGGSVNPYYAYRLTAARDLIKTGKIKYLVISGDNSRKDYNEPQEMRNDLVRQGIDSTIIFLDYAGFRTFDSMIRLKEIFGQTSVTVISQPFHNERAIYIASKNGIDAIGFNAHDVGKNVGLKVQLREKFARVKVFIDQFFGKKPKYLGKKIELPE